VKVPPISAARRKSGRPPGNRDWFDVIGRAQPDCRQAQQTVAPRRPYNEQGKKSKFGLRRYLPRESMRNGQI